MSGSLVSPGVQVSITDQSAYGSSGPGTVPLIIIATASNKLQPGSTTAIAPGTLSANAGDLYLITSQRDALQTFGNPTFYSAAGTVQYNNELNELGLFTLYTYLGIATTAYVIRANVDLAQLVPTTTAPTGPTVSGTYWLDLVHSTWGIFQSNGNINSAYSWQNQTPLVISNAANLENIVQGFSTHNGPIISGSTMCITGNGNLVINGVSVAMMDGYSISQVASVINSSIGLQLVGISAMVYIRQGKYVSNASSYGDIFDIRLISNKYMQTITLAGSTPSVLQDLGFPSSAEPVNFVVPTSSYGTSGKYAINTLMDANGNYSNAVFQMITLATSNTTTNWWFQVGTTETENPGFSWQGAVPTVLTGSIGFGSTTTAIIGAGAECTIQIGSSAVLTVTIPSPYSLSSFVTALNAAFNGASINAVASIVTNSGLNYLVVTNYGADQIYLHDYVNQNGPSSLVATPWATVGIPTSNTYWNSTTGSVSSPAYIASTLLTASASVVAPGTGYLVNDPLVVNGGVFTTASVLTVASLQVVGALPNVPGTGYRVNDTITFSSVGFAAGGSCILVVDAIDGSGGITGVSISQAGQYSGLTPPTVSVAPNSSSGAGVNATIDITWGVNTVTVTTPGNYTQYPTSPVTVTAGSGINATFNIVSGFLTSTSFGITLPGQTPVVIHVPAAPNNTLAGIVSAINSSSIGFSNAGPIQALVATSYNGVTGTYLQIANLNGTAFTLTDYSGTPLNTSGISAGVTFARQMLYQGYQPSLQTPSTLSALAANNVWINTTPGGLGANLVVKKYVSGEWIAQNATPNTGTIPMYASTAAADSAFGGLKAIGSIFAQYNYYGTTPSTANIVLQEWSGTAWEMLNHVPSLLAPTGPAVNGTLWYNTDLQVDIMVNNGQQWLGYRNMYPGTDPNGPILSSAEPTTQSTGAALVDYDLWVDTNIIPYPTINRFNAMTSTWVLVDNTNHIDSAGIVFADARSNSGYPNFNTSESQMILSNYVDADVPDAMLYPPYILLFNTRYSTYNVKQWKVNYFPQNKGTAYSTDAWVTYSGNAPDGTPYMGPAAQRAVVADAMNAALASNTDARASQNFYNLISTPGYPECIAEMVNLNVDINNIAFVIGDTPSTLQPTGTSIQNWATNAANAATNSDAGLITHSSYLGLWYPWGLTSNLQGSSVVVPPSLIALTTIAYSDSVSYPWFAPAGFNRGLVSVVSSVGYLDTVGDYIPVTLNQGQRDVLYTNDINPIAYMPGRGLVVWGQKTLDPLQTAMNRINVTRLVNYLSYNLNNLAQPFLFEQNDVITRTNVAAAFISYMQSLVGLRALYDFSVVCDTSNNTPATIAANQLWIDIAIQPEIAIEFIYIPVRVLATGAPMPGSSGG